MGEVQSSEELKFPEQLNCLFYGLPGGGKTTFATTFPKPILFFDIDLRNQTYSGMKDVDYITYEDKERAGAYRDFLRDLRKYQTGSKYKTVCIDSTTTLLRIMKNEILGIRGTGSASTEGLSLAQWGQVTERFEKIFDIARNYDKHMIITAHEQAFQDELTGEIKRVVMMIGKKFPQKAPLFFDEVYRCFREEGRGEKPARFLFRTQSTRRYHARTSLNVRDAEGNTIPILDEVEEQHFDVIRKKIEEAKKDPLAYAEKAKKNR